MQEVMIWMMERNICKFVPSTLADGLRIACFVSETNPEIMQRKHRLKDDMMILVVGGEGVFCLDHVEIPAKAGTLVFGFAGESISVEPMEKFHYLYIRFEGQRAEVLLRRFEIDQCNRSFAGFDGLIPLWKESLARASEQTIDLAAESMLLYTFSRLSVIGVERNDPIKQVIRITEEQFKDPSLSLAAVAEELSYNPKYLSSAFKKKVGLGYSEYLSSVRVKYAVSLFDHGIDSVKNVALLSGFSDPLYFSSVFKSKIGSSPTDYIKSKSK